jgi:hypothetical protein
LIPKVILADARALVNCSGWISPLRIPYYRLFPVLENVGDKLE